MFRLHVDVYYFTLLITFFSLELLATTDYDWSTSATCNLQVIA